MGRSDPFGAHRLRKPVDEFETNLVRLPKFPVGLIASSVEMDRFDQIGRLRDGWTRADLIRRARISSLRKVVVETVTSERQRNAAVSCLSVSFVVEAQADWGIRSFANIVLPQAHGR